MRRAENKANIRTKEGVKAVNEAIDFLRKAQVVPLLKWNAQLAIASKEHVEDIGMKGLMQHESSSGKEAKDRI